MKKTEIKITDNRVALSERITVFLGMEQQVPQLTHTEKNRCLIRHDATGDIFLHSLIYNRKALIDASVAAICWYFISFLKKAIANLAA